MGMEEPGQQPLAGVASQAEPPSNSWGVQVGLPAMAVSLGLAMTSYINFSIGCLLIVFGGLLFCWEWHKSVGTRTRKWQTGGWAGIAGCFCFLVWILFRPVPFDVSFLPVADEYADGTEIAGIKWNRVYFQTRIVMVNPSDDQYTNISFRVRTNLAIAAIGFVSAFSQCGSEPVTPGIVTSGMTLTTPSPQGGLSVLKPEQISQTFRVFCDRILSDDKVEVVIATVGTRQLMRQPGHLGSMSLWIAISGSFDGFGRSRTLKHSDCLAKNCPDIVSWGP